MMRDIMRDIMLFFYNIIMWSWQRDIMHDILIFFCFSTFIIRRKQHEITKLMHDAIFYIREEIPEKK
jgi:hypothetical protein